MARSRRRPGAGLPRGMRRDRDCFTCKQFGTKCDLNRPSCGPCNQRSVKCEGYAKRVVWMTGCSSQPTKARAARTSFETKRSGKGYPDFFSLIVQPFVDSYEDLASSIRFMPFHPNHGGSAVVGIHVGNDIYRRSVRAYFRSVHQYTRLRAFGPSVDGLSLDSAHSIALKDLNDLISIGEVHAIFAIATLALSDVTVSNTSGRWQLHLAGARAFLDTKLPNQETRRSAYRQIPGLRSVVSLLVLYDVFGAVMRGDGTLVFGDPYLDEMDATIVAVVGCSQDSFELLTASCRSKPLNSDSTKDLVLLQAMKLKPASWHMEEEDSIANAWRYAAIITAITSRVHGHEFELTKCLQHALDQLRSTIEAMPVHNALPCHASLWVAILRKHEAATSLDSKSPPSLALSPRLCDLWLSPTV